MEGVGGLPTKIRGGVGAPTIKLQRRQMSAAAERRDRRRCLNYQLLEPIQIHVPQIAPDNIELIYIDPE